MKNLKFSNKEALMFGYSAAHKSAYFLPFLPENRHLCLGLLCPARPFSE